MKSLRKNNRITHALISCLLAIVMIIGLFPAFTAQAAQEGAYYDPAEHWQTTGTKATDAYGKIVVPDKATTGGGTTTGGGS